MRGQGAVRRSVLTRSWSRVVAASYDPVAAVGDRWFLARHRADLLAGLSGRVLLVGAGTGWSFPYLEALDASLEVHAIEPDSTMRRRARARAAEMDLDVILAAARAETLPYRDGSFDAVVTSLVLCSVDDLDAVRGELSRVLRSGGELRLLEHVRAPGIRGRAQRAVAPLWHPLAGGCHLTRRPHEAYERDPTFSVIDCEEIDGGLFPIRPFVRARFRRH